MQTFRFKKAVIDDPRLTSPQCNEMQPVIKEFETPWFSIFNRGGYYTYETPWPNVCVLPVVDKNKILMVGAKRELLAATSIELVSGGIEPGESAIEAAARELKEEAGIVINDLTRFEQQIPYSVVSSRIPNLVYIFEIALTIDEFNNRNEHDDEVEEVYLFSFDDIKRKVNNGEIYAALPVAAVLKKIFL